jgi:outer membrane immunogenic protein
VRTLVIVCAALAFSGPALAADLAPNMPAKAPPAPVAAPYNWSGWYVGLNAGGAWGHSADPTTVAFSPPGYFEAISVSAIDSAGAQTNHPSGFIGGGQAGVNWQSGVYVTGIEADFNYLGLKKSTTSTGAYPCCGPTTGFAVSSSISTDWLATIRGRLGLANNNWLYYFTGGVAFTDLKANFGFTDFCLTYAACGGIGFPGPVGSEAATVSTLKTGYTVGGGVEAGLSGNWSIKAEYLYVNFGSVSTGGLITTPAQIGFGTNDNPFSHSANLTVNILRAGLNYKFN